MTLMPNLDLSLDGISSMDAWASSSAEVWPGNQPRGYQVSICREAEFQTPLRNLYPRVPGNTDTLKSLRSTALSFSINFSEEQGPENYSLWVLRALRWPLANYHMSPLAIGKKPFWPRSSWLLAIYQKGFKNSMLYKFSKTWHIYDFGLVVLLIKPYIKSMYWNRLNK